MNRKLHIASTIMTVALLLSIFFPAMAFSASASPAQTPTLKTEDIFRGSFSPQEKVAASGDVFDVVFSLCPTMDAPHTTISFVLPADLVKLVSGNQAWTGDLRKGELLTLTLSLAANGEIEAYVKADVKACVSGKDYSSSYYLHVATPNAGSGSTVLSGSMQPGFLRPVNLQYVSTTSSPAQSRSVEDPKAQFSTSGTIEVRGKFMFLDENGGYSAARNMEVRLKDNNDAAWSVIGWTNGTGYFDFIVANSAVGRSPILDLIAEGTWDWIGKDSNGAQYWWSTGVLATNVQDDWVWTNYGLSPGNNNDILQAGDAVYAETQMIYDWTGWMRSKVTIHWPQETWPHSHGDSIDLPLKTTAAWNHVTVQHEEAHCIMWALYGSFPTGSGPYPQYVWSESHASYAFTEGWADFMSCAVDNNASNVVDYYNGHGGNMETNDWFNCNTAGNMDGENVTGSIASILWDIFDPVNIAGDKDYMNWGFDEIFTVMNSDKPQNMFDFWNDWGARWPDNSTSKGPLCTIYYHYGIDEDWFNPWGSVTINGGATYTPSRTVTLTLDGEDWGVGVQYMRFSQDYGVTWGSWYNYATTFTYTITSPNDGWKWIDVQYADYWWLSNPGSIYDGIGLDTTPPTGTILIANGSTYTTSRTVKLNLTATDNYSGVALMRFSENMGTWGSWVPFATTYTYTLTTPNDGTKSVDVQFQDYAGQNSTMWAIWDYILLDTTKPTGTVLINNGAKATSSTSVYLNLTYTDTGSGVYKIRFGNTGDPWSAWETPSPTKAWTIPSGDGTKYVWCEVMDNAGLWSDQFYDAIILDTVNPNGSIIVNNGNPTYTNTKSVTLYLTYSDSGSGVYRVRYGNSGGSWSAWEAPAATRAWNLTVGDGTKYVWYQVMDYAGLTSTMYSDSIILDTVNPTGSIIVNNGNPTYTTKTSVTLYLTYYDGMSGVYEVRYGNSGEPWSYWEAPSAARAWNLTSGDGTKTVWYQVTDYAGLMSPMYSDIIILDTTKPTTAIVHSAGSSNVTLNATDAVSGVKFTYYRINASSWINYTGQFTLTGTGNRTIDYFSGDKAGNNETMKTLKVYYLTVNVNPSGITTISGTGWYNQGTNATTGTAPATVASGGKDYIFSTWKKDGTSVGGNPIKVLMDTAHTATATYVAFQFNITATPTTTINLAGTMTNYTVTANLMSTTTKNVTWSASGLPSGATYSFSPSSGNPTFTSQLGIKTNSTTPPGNYTITIKGTGPITSHSITVTLRVMNLTVTTTPFSPNGDGVKDNTAIKATFWASVAWTLRIKNSTGTIVRNLASGTSLSLSVLWNGKTDGNITVPDGTYTIVLNGTGFSQTKSVVVDNKAPTVTCSWKPNPFNPHSGQTSTLNYTLSENCVISIQIYNSTGSLVRKLLASTTKNAGNYTIVWNGKNDASAVVAAGTYTCRIYATDTAGNKVNSPTGYKTCTIQAQ